MSLENDAAHYTEFCPELVVCQLFDLLQDDTVSAASKLTVTVPTVRHSPFLNAFLLLVQNYTFSVTLCILSNVNINSTTHGSTNES
jgi:hypothetical protein